jgi:hypothetical protein
MMRTRLRLSQAECIALLVLYGVFVGWIVLETAGVTAIVT